MTDMTWHTMPKDQGQIVEVSYAADEEYLYRRTIDRSVPETIYERISWAWYGDPETGDDLGPFEPWNGRLGVRPDADDWEPCEYAEDA